MKSGLPITSKAKENHTREALTTKYLKTNLARQRSSYLVPICIYFFPFFDCIFPYLIEYSTRELSCV
ncbi:MAG TPA: hypothetical protein DDY43_03040 [Synechococcales bacterium UBA10510]|nr:hypothetical protein [Synechococcales bacterium UBA10510]